MKGVHGINIKCFYCGSFFKNLNPPPPQVYLRHLFIYWIVKDLNLTISSVAGSEAKRYTLVGTLPWWDCTPLDPSGELICRYQNFKHIFLKTVIPH